MKPLLLPISMLLVGCTPTIEKSHFNYDYVDVKEATISWSNIFLQKEDQYSVYFYSPTCGHCAEIKQDILAYYFESIETLYFVQTDEDTKFGSKTDLIGVNDIDSFHIFGTPFLINIKDHSVLKYYAGVNSILSYIDENTK